MFAQNKQEPVSRAANVTLGHPSKMYTSLVHNGGRKGWKTFPSARAQGQQGQQGPRTAEPCVRELLRKAQPALEFGSSFQFSEARDTSVPALHTGLCCLSLLHPEMIKAGMFPREIL